MAGAGYRTFTAGQVLTAAQVQTYLQDQSVMVFDSAAARSSALGTSVAEGMVTYLKDTNAVEYYDSSAWKNVGDKAILKSDFTAAGQLLTASASGVPSFLSAGSAGQILLSGGTSVYWGSISLGGVSFYYKSQGTTVAQTFGTGLWAINYRGGGNVVFGGVAYAQGSHLAEYTSEPASLVIPSQLGLGWTTVSSTPPKASIETAFGNNVWISANSAGDNYIWRSTDLVTWTSVAITSVFLRAMTFGNGIFVAGGAGGEIRVSTDGTTWNTRTSPVANAILSMRYLNSRYVGCTNNGIVFSSTDSITWSSSATPLSLVYKMNFGNGQYFGGGYDGGGTGRVIYSTDLVTWTSTGTTRTSNVYDVAYFNNLYIAFHDGVGVSYSTNLVTWTNGGGFGGWDHEILSATSIVAATNSNVVQISTNGITWTTTGIISVVEDQTRSVVLGNNVLLLGNTGNRYYTSSASNVYVTLEQKSPLVTV